MVFDFKSADPESLFESLAAPAEVAARMSGAMVSRHSEDPRLGLQSESKEHHLLLIAPEHAEILASNGWSKDDIRTTLHRKITSTLRRPR